MSVAVFDADYQKAHDVLAVAGLSSLHEKIAMAIAIERERCATIALEQRCERATGWDEACVAIAAAIRSHQ